jgi:hypothetical protein
MSIQPRDVTPEVINALDVLRNVARTGPGRREALTWAINVLDDVGVFAEIDEVTGYEVPSGEGYGSEAFRDEMRREEQAATGRLA